MPDPFDGEGLCFLGGAPRSGLALMRRALVAHPQIVCGADTGIAPAIALQAADFQKNLGSLHASSFHLGADDVRGIFGRLIVRCLRPERDAATIVCEKTPLNILVFERLAEMLPQARFIHVVRDGRDVASSLLMRDWRDPATGATFAHVKDPAAAASYWKGLAEIGLRAEAALARSGRLMRVAYEDLVRAPGAAQRAIFSFLGARADVDLADNPGAVEWSVIERESMPQLVQPVTPARIGAAKTRLSPRDYALVEQIARPALTVFGYC